MLFPSLLSEEAIESGKKLDALQQGSLFHSIEYELSGIINKIENIDSLNESEINDIIIRQHQMILNYDLFLMSNDTRKEALTLFTNRRFLRCFLGVVRLLQLSSHEKTCLNKIAYDYYILPKNDKEIADMLYRLTTEINGKEVVVLSGIIGMHNAQILAMIRHSTFKIEKAVHRVNTFLLRCNIDLSIQNIIDIYCHIFDRFTNLFIYTMLETKPKGLTYEQYKIFDRISVAILDILNSLSSVDIKKVLQDYGYTLSMVKGSTTYVRFAIKTAKSYNRILNVIKEIEMLNDMIIP